MMNQASRQLMKDAVTSHLHGMAGQATVRRLTEAQVREALGSAPAGVAAARETSAAFGIQTSTMSVHGADARLYDANSKVQSPVWTRSANDFPAASHRLDTTPTGVHRVSRMHAGGLSEIPNVDKEGKSRNAKAIQDAATHLWPGSSDLVLRNSSWRSEPPLSPDDCGVRADECSAGGVSGGRYRPGSTYEMPPESSWGSPDCAYRTWSFLTENTRECDIPRMDNHYVCDPFEDEIAVGGHITVDGASANMEDFFRAAWNLLRINTDLIEWIMCLVADSDAGCILDTIEGEFTIYVSDEVRVTADGSASGPEPCPSLAWTYISWQSRISVCSTHAAYAKWEKAWCDGSGHDRLCALIDLAVLLFHEVTHWCLLSLDDSANNCEISYLAENTLKWAMLIRYPAAMESDCCRDSWGEEVEIGGTSFTTSAVRDSLFMQDTGQYMASCP